MTSRAASVTGSGRRRLRHGLCALACIGIAGTLLSPPPSATAQGVVPRAGAARSEERRAIVIHDDTWDDGWDDFNQTLIQMQRESISSQEEQAREAGRVRRREEIERDQQKSAVEHEAYFDAVLEDSQAALKAPVGIYYRKPGYTAADGPGGGARSFELGDFTYFYDKGVFWLQQGETFIVVTAPFGAVVGELPRGVTRIQYRSGPFWYYFGTFYGEKNGTFEVVKPPAGLTVFYLPDGYSQADAQGSRLYRFGEVFFKPVFVQGILAFQVVDP